MRYIALLLSVVGFALLCGGLFPPVSANPEVVLYELPAATPQPARQSQPPIAQQTLPPTAVVPPNSDPESKSEFVAKPREADQPKQNPLVSSEAPSLASYTLGVPVRLVIPAINLDVPVEPAVARKVLLAGDVFEQWKAPKFAAGWHGDSALLGEPGNTVINGHNNEFGEVFRYLEKVNAGDIILVFSADRKYSYIVTNKMILPEADETPKKRAENASWIGISFDERITLVTCWPYESNTHRLILVAKPLQ